MTESANPYAEAWSSDEYLPAGDYVVTINDVDGTKTSGGGYPQIELEVGCVDGTRRDWLVITPQTTGKIGQVIQAIGAPLPDPATEINGADLRLSQSYLDANWKGKQVGVLIRDEPKYNDPTVMQPRIKSYVPAAKIAGRMASDVTPAAFQPPANPPAQQAFAGAGAVPQSAINDDIPF